MSSVESIFFWAAAVALATSFFATMVSLIFGRAWGLKLSMVGAISALCALTIFGVLRWSATGHPPFVTLFESMTNAVWFALLIFFVVYALRREFAILLTPISGLGFMLLGWSSSLETSASPLSSALENVWLFIHASFATSGAAVFLLAASLAVIYLMGEARLERTARLAIRVPEYAAIPKTMLNFVIFGMIVWGVMIVSGSIWANAAWGRYWAWDPIELWSLISWLLYGLLLHARLTFKVSPRTFSWATIAALLTVVFALWGVNYVYETIHTYG